MICELVIVDAFRFADGQTVLTCEAASVPKYIGPCQCALQLKGETVARLRLDGENLPDPNRSGFRVVSTREAIDLDAHFVKERAYKLLCYE